MFYKEIRGYIWILFLERYLLIPRSAMPYLKCLFTFLGFYQKYNDFTNARK